MLTAEVVPPESARYAAALVLVPGLWAGTHAWRGFAAYLAHRGWECHLVAVHDHGGIAARAAAVAAYAATLPSRPILVGHDAGALVALAAATRGRALAAVSMAPLVPGSGEVRALLGGLRPLVAALLGRSLPPPAGPAATRYWGEVGDPLRVRVGEGGGAEDGALVRDLLLGRAAPTPAPELPVLLLAGEHDPFLPTAAARALAGTLGAEHQVLPGAGHWPHLHPATWQRTVGALHRWLVQRLGEPLLELYVEAMAERDNEE